MWNWAFNTPCKSLKGILVLFEEERSYTRDTSKFYNPKIQKVSVIVEGKPNQLGEVENSEFSENSETSENQFSEVFNLSFPFCTIPKTENSELKTSEICSEVVPSNSGVLWSNSEVFQLRLFHFALHSKRKTRR